MSSPASPSSWGTAQQQPSFRVKHEQKLEHIARIMATKPLQFLIIGYGGFTAILW